MFYASV
jgi:hypothetical protein